jgi:DNA-binding transcriptional LysR family regulator
VKLGDIDLNLLLVFDHLMREGKVTRVAETLGMSQPAVSHALRRLRTLLDDELFLRQPQGMAPTPYAQQLAIPLAQALRTLQEALSVRASFDPAISRRCFSLAMTDVGELYFLPVLMDHLARVAPGVTLRIAPVSDPGLPENMAAGRIDLALGTLPRLRTGFFRQTLFRQRYVALMRHQHPLARYKLINAVRYRRAIHVRVVAAGTGHGAVEDALDRLGLDRQVALTVPHYVALGHVLARGDLLATVPERFAERVCGPFPLCARPLDLNLPESQIAQHWHHHLHRDPGHQWFRARVADLFGRQALAQADPETPA